jgi:signal transduction histidine kinase
MALPQLAPPDRRVAAGVAGGIGEALGVDPNLVRLVFALLALAGGAGVVLYIAAWFAMSDERRRRQPWVPVLLLVVAGSLALSALGLSVRAVVGLALVAGGLALIWRRSGSLRPDAPLSLAGLGLAAGGVFVLLTGGGAPASFLAPGAVAGALLLVVAPWLWQLGLERDAGRTARIRTEERAEVAARVHDSVLQTLALVQRHADDPRRVAALARRQERELRSWLYGGAANGDTLTAALAAAAADVEELHGVRIELASSGDCPFGEDVQPLVLAAREAMANAAKFSGADEISVYTEVEDGSLAVFVRDRGVGFDRAAVAPDRRGLADSIEARLRRAGGDATIVSVPGEGTEVELTLPRRVS